MRPLLLCLAISLAGAYPAHADLQSQLTEMARRHDGKVAFFALHVPTGRSVAIDADRPVKTASVIKLAR